MTLRLLATLLLAVIAPRPAAAQLDPLLFLKRTTPNVILAVETAQRMQRDANDDYRDGNIYTKTGQAWETTLGVTAGNTASKYRRTFVGLKHTEPDMSGGPDRFTAADIVVVGDLDPAYANFEEATKLSIARRALRAAIAANQQVARFGLVRTRQSNPRLGPEGNLEAKTALAALSSPTDTGKSGKWKITRPEVDANNGSVAGPVAPLVPSDAASANTSVLDVLALTIRDAGGLVPGGNDGKTAVDVPLDNMLDDIKAEAVRLATADTQCRNTVAVLVVAGGEGSTTAEDPAAKASQFLTIGANHRVPIHVIAIVPVAADVPQLQAIAANSGGRYTEITAAMVAGPVAAAQPVPELVRAVNHAVQHAFTAQADCDTDPTSTLPLGPYTEHQVTSPIVGTVNLENAADIAGAPLPNTVIYRPGTIPPQKIPQRSNVLVTSGFRLPGFDGMLRAFRVYKPVVDATKPSGYRFSADGTRLWVASAPAAASRNIYTALPDGSVIAFDPLNAAVLQSYLYPAALQPSATLGDAIALINYIRSQPLGAIVGSTPAILDAPSLDPPPDSDYPGYADANKNRRTLVWVGANDGMLHAVDGRLGIEVWAFIPFNLLPKLHTLRGGQPVGDFRYFVDGSPKVADVKIDGAWRTYLIVGQGAGGTFYQAFDVTLPNMAATVAPDSDSIAGVLAYFALPTSVPLTWSFPRYSSFDPAIAPYGDVATAATDVEKTVGETWSDPAVGQIESASGLFTVLTGSGFLKDSVQQQAHRAGAVAGTTFYLLDVKTGTVLDSRSVGTDGQAENVDSCAAVNDCRKLKNALQADPVATGPPDSRFITKAYIGDLDGRVWRFDVKLNAALLPIIAGTPTKLYDAGAAHPMFSSMAAVNVGGTQQYLFQATGSDLLPSNSVSQPYKLLVVLDSGATGTKTAEIALEATDGSGGEEKATAFPAVAGDIVFFATTTFNVNPCVLPNANLYAFTFIGGPAYDTNNDGTLKSNDSPRVRTTIGARASAPFIVDQHLVFAAGGQIEMFGDPQDYNNGVGQVGVRILSWREVR